MKKIVTYIAILAGVILVGFFVLRSFRSAEQSFNFETVKISKGSISNTVTASGTLEAITTVEVGTQVSGVIQKIYVDFNSEVKKGQLLAQLDETPLKAQLEQSKASVDQAQAEVDYQKANYERNKILAEKKLIAQSDYDLVVYNYNKAKASLANAKSVYDKNKINLDYAFIYSPIDGIILERAVEEGQTVAASFNTPTLFTIANDLTQMEVEASIDEADIGQVKLGQRVEFTVDSYPDMKFDGTITQVRLQPVQTNNVITYTVIIQAPNPEKKLMPGMTASTTIFVNEKTDILVLPGKAARFEMDQNTMKAYMKSLPEGEFKAPQEAMPAMQPMANTDKTKTNSQTIWVKKDARLLPVNIETGESDGINYEVLSGLKEGDEVITSMTLNKVEETKKASASPFMPQRPGGGPRM